jgi:hypothetical protein
MIVPSAQTRPFVVAGLNEVQMNRLNKKLLHSFRFRVPFRAAQKPRVNCGGEPKS